MTRSLGLGGQGLGVVSGLLVSVHAGMRAGKRIYSTPYLYTHLAGCRPGAPIRGNFRHSLACV